MRVVIDTDIGNDPDDAFALALALGSPEIELVGVTIVDGDVDTRAAMAARILGLAGRRDILVYKGRSKPLGAGTMPNGHGREGVGLLDRAWRAPGATVSDQDAVDWLLEESRREPFWLVAIGPLTNIATAISADPTFRSRLLGITVMGGVVNALEQAWSDRLQALNLEPGSLDYNTASDPEAARIVGSSGDVTWVPCEVTFSSRFTHANLSELRSIRHELSDALVALAEVWASEAGSAWPLPNGQTFKPPIDEETALLMHDPLTCSYVLGGDWMTEEAATVTYATRDGLFEISNQQDSVGIPAVIVTSVDADRFAQAFLRRVKVACAGSSQQPKGPPGQHSGDRPTKGGR